MEQQYLYHYTSIYALRHILKDKLLKMSNTGEKVHSLWFSSNQLWEISATRLTITGNDDIKQQSKEEQHEAIGLARIALKNSIQFTSWKNYLKQARIPLAISREMENWGNTNEWFCRLKNIPSSQWEKIEIWDGESWIPYSKDYIDTHFPVSDYDRNKNLSLVDVMCEVF